MDSSCEQKKMKVEVDRLSSLPDDLVHKVLSFIGTKHVVQTSALSSRWRYTWTSMPYLDFSSEDFAKLPIFSKFVTHVLSGRNNEIEVSSLKLSFRGKISQVFVRRVLKYAVSHNVQQMTVCLLEKDIEFPLSLFISQSLEHLSLTCYRTYITLTSTWELPALTTLHLSSVSLCDDNSEKCVGVLAMCANLKNLTLERYKTIGSNGFTICHPRLSNLTLENGHWSGKVVNVVAPQLENLTIVNYPWECQHLVSAPNLTSLVCKGYRSLQLHTDGFPALEKADLCVSSPHNSEVVRGIVCLLQQLHSVKSLTLSLETVELLSSSMELISHQPSPFSNLKSLAIYPKDVCDWTLPKEKVSMSTNVKSYLLDGSPGAMFTMVLREEIILPKRMATLHVLLEQEKANIETNTAQIERRKVLIKSSWKELSLQFEQRRSKAWHIISELQLIESLLKRLPESKRAMSQPCFASLCAEADIVMSIITDCMKIHFDENQSFLSVYFRELATKFQSPS